MLVGVGAADGGARRWTAAQLTRPAGTAEFGRQWSWVQWSANVPVPPGASEVTLTCRATDSGYNTQPEYTEDLWNLRGYLSSAMPRVRVRVAGSEEGRGGTGGETSSSNSSSSKSISNKSSSADRKCDDNSSGA